MTFGHVVVRRVAEDLPGVAWRLIDDGAGAVVIASNTAADEDIQWAVAGAQLEIERQAVAWLHGELAARTPAPRPACEAVQIIQLPAASM
jgi:hypothetical protein